MMKSEWSADVFDIKFGSSSIQVIKIVKASKNFLILSFLQPFIGEQSYLISWVTESVECSTVYILTLGSEHVIWCRIITLCHVWPFTCKLPILYRSLFVMAFSAYAIVELTLIFDIVYKWCTYNNSQEELIHYSFLLVLELHAVNKKLSRNESIAQICR
jgi:hypothetical protein